MKTDPRWFEPSPAELETRRALAGVRRAEFWLGMAYCFILAVVWVGILVVSIRRG